MRRISGLAVRGLVVSGLVVVLAACGHQSPQIPSQRKGQAPQVDSTQLVLMQFNQQMAQAADEQLAAYVQKLDEPYALYEGNVWATVLEQGDIYDSPKDGEEWTVHMRIYSLDGQLLTDSEGTYHVGKQELPAAVDKNTTEWHRGCRIRMFAPWYSAYGLQGTEHIPPYENVMIEIELK